MAWPLCFTYAVQWSGKGSSPAWTCAAGSWLLGTLDADSRLAVRYVLLGLIFMAHEPPLLTI